MPSILSEQYRFCDSRFLLNFSSKKSGKGKKPGKGGNRFWKSIGLGFKTPREAIEGIVVSFVCSTIFGVSVFEGGHCYLR